MTGKTTYIALLLYEELLTFLYRKLDQKIKSKTEQHYNALNPPIFNVYIPEKYIFVFFIYSGIILQIQSPVA